MKLNFARNVRLKLKIDESDFLHWFKSSVDPPEFVGSLFGKNNKHLLGELNKNRFWLEKKNKFFFTRPFSPLELDLSSISGIYQVRKNSVLLHLQVKLNKHLRNFFLIGIPIWVIIGLFQYVLHEQTWAIVLAGLSILGMGLILWRVHRDSRLLKKYIKSQFGSIG